jgi:hypothetical protein
MNGISEGVFRIIMMFAVIGFGVTLGLVVWLAISIFHDPDLHRDSYDRHDPWGGA